MKKALSLLLKQTLMMGTLMACTPAGTESPVVEKKPYEDAVVTKFDGYTVTLEKPIVVYQGNEGDDAWGHTNFPAVSRTAEGYLRVRWLYGEDKVGAVGNVSNSRVSMNEGKSWLPLNSAYTNAAPSMMMKNGKCWAGFRSAGTPKSAQLFKQIAEEDKLKLESGHTLILAEAIEKYDLANELNLTKVSMNEYDPETGVITAHDCKINWPYAAVVHFPGDNFYSISATFALSGTNVIATADGTLYTCIYMHGYDPDAATLEEAATDYVRKGKYFTYVFESVDSGRTWDYLASFQCGDEFEGWENYECYCEPKMVEMPDGSLFMLMRTGSRGPMYSTVSHDKGRTWSKPKRFNYCGVLPQLLSLDCGVTIATYGRPDLFVTVTNDPSGDTWEEHIKVPLAAPDNTSIWYKSCFYTSLLKIDENSAWFCYTDFKYPNKNGVPVKSVLLRKITVTFDE